MRTGFGLSTAGDSGFRGSVFRVAHPRWFGTVVAFGTAVLGFGLNPQVERLREIDRSLIGALAGVQGEVAGRGTTDAPWTIEQRAVPERIEAPRVLRLDANEGNYFESMPPPSPDLMVVLARLHEAGLQSAGFGYPLQWEDPDTLALEAMRGVMDRYDRAVIGYVVKDSTAAVPVPPPFLRASMRYAEVGGDATKLPVVNGVVGLAPEYGGDRTWGGFTRLETEEPEESRAYLLARWSDRVIFSVPLALEIARLGLSPETDVRVEMGKEIALGEQGPRIPIDFRGRVDLPDAVPERRDAPATAVIARSLPEDFITDAAPLFFTDERLLGDKADQRWAERLPRIDAAVRGAPAVVGSDELPRWPLSAELGGLLVLAGGGSLLTGFGGVLRRMTLAVVWIAIAAATLFVSLRSGFGAPMPLGFLAVPAALLLTVLFLDSVPKVEVVRGSADASGHTPGQKNAPPKKRGKGRRKRGGKKR